MCISIHIMFSSPENFQGVHRIPCCLASRFKNGRPREPAPRSANVASSKKIEDV